MPQSFLDEPVQYIKTIGPRRSAALQKLGIFTVGDLLYHFPRRYEDRTRLKPAAACADGEIATLRGTVLAVQDLKPKRGLTVTKLAVHDGRGIFYAVWFNQGYIKKNLPPGTRVFVTGKAEKGFGATQVVVEDYEFDEGTDCLSAGRIVPVYPLTARLNQRVLRTAVKFGLDHIKDIDGDFLPAGLLEKLSLPRLKESLYAIHFPEREEDACRARSRFIFEELFLFQLALAAFRRNISGLRKPHRYMPDGRLILSFINALPYRLTDEQAKVWKEISGDLESPSPMHRLLQGDVGSGKTVISALALLKAVENSLQGVLMAPTEILAEQHYLGMKKSLASTGVEVGLLTGGMRRKEKKKLLEQVRSGETKILIGTHALLQEDVDFKKLGLVIVDEQHRFGVRQRAALQYKGYFPDTLVMTATPIPRTLALTLYGDMDISVIGRLPPGRKPVKTYAVLPGAMKKVYSLIGEQVRLGRQAYIVCPLVEESGKIDLKSASELADRLARNEFRDFRVGLLHGRMKADEKDGIMASFRRGELDVLVSTTVIEVGVDVPNATVMVILDAERFGLAQLHQLRGRVGRGGHQSYCILVADPKTDESRARLKAMTQTGDGFVLAEEDLRLRGPGDFYGTRQSGLPEFKIADPVRDYEILLTARQEAIGWIENDRNLAKPETMIMLEEIKKRFWDQAPGLLTY
ncbi:MAG TPA: ATP-dependent DNA helicase RecG [Bacillota bacterium]|nr:ATP-dependent DNA helicase RecG [Bacillota bacterium]